MKNIILLLSVILLLLSCKKEKIDVGIIGRWQFRGFTEIARYGTNPTRLYQTDMYESTLGYNSIAYGSVNLEILAEGLLIFNSDSGEEKFRVIGKEPIEIETFDMTNTNGTGLMAGWCFKLKTNSGQRFEFKLYYNHQRDRIYTVPWTKGSTYYHYTAPYSGSESMLHLGEYLIFPDWYSGGGVVGSSNKSVKEYLGKFKRL